MSDVRRFPVPGPAEAEVRTLADCTRNDQCMSETQVPGWPDGMLAICQRRNHTRGRHLFIAYEGDQLFAVDWTGETADA